MERRTNTTTDAATGLLPLIEAGDGGLGAALLRLAHRAAAAHRYEAATTAAAKHDPAEPFSDAMTDPSGRGGTR